MHKAPDAIILCGGAGLRLRSVTGHAPKSMAHVAGRPFLELLLRQLQRNGFERVILAGGYQMNTIRSYFGDRVFNLDLIYSVESSPLGTGGALRNAVGLIESDDVLFMNGDSYTDADLSGFTIHHRKSKADMSMVVVPVDGRDDCGCVLIDHEARLVRFEEKQSTTGARFINAGIYIASHDMLGEIPPGLQISLEKELFPQWLATGKDIRTVVHSGQCVDIGTPERYQNAQGTLSQVEIS